ncbi:hypothetical protein CNMCM5793_003928 [Aspergillus hiratsukae]|uniref:Uncharacterized protein n=1 Tax=Aspergillus hiratsukae TaxID=1194566 RepID=A0A8H6Q8S6_9EURO|nr:hypothetical protein CNMCM5793_003928 [Aspergillus hiratsukae]KAF7169231.1 hypothetical protein CNMCM6106_004180 [Aspergillus hiratsukae]
MNEQRTLIASYLSEEQIAMSKGDLYDLIEDGFLDSKGEEVGNREWEVERIGGFGLNATPVMSNQFWKLYCNGWPLFPTQAVVNSPRTTQDIDIVVLRGQTPAARHLLLPASPNLEAEPRTNH